MGSEEMKERAETLVDKLLDIAARNPASWVILLVYTAIVFLVGMWIG